MIAPTFKRENYIQIQGWMIVDLKLSGNELLIFAIIFGFCQTTNQSFTGSISYLASALNCSKKTIQNNLNTLVKNKLLTKENYTENFINRCKYRVYDGVWKKLPQGMEKITTGYSKNYHGGMEKITEGGMVKSSMYNTNINNTNNNTIYNSFEKTEKIEKWFLETWAKARMYYQKEETNITRLNYAEKTNLIKWAKDYNELEFKKAMRGLFEQKNIYQSFKLRPTKFLEQFETFLDCFVNGINLYDDNIKKDNYSSRNIEIG